MNSLNQKLDEARKNLYSAVLSDTLDSMGLLNQVLEPGIRPIDESKVLCGWARVGLYFPISPSKRMSATELLNLLTKRQRSRQLLKWSVY